MQTPKMLRPKMQDRCSDFTSLKEPYLGGDLFQFPEMCPTWLNTPDITYESNTSADICSVGGSHTRSGVNVYIIICYRRVAYALRA